MSKRNEILNAVIQKSNCCISPNELTISSVAKAAGVGKSTVYEYFPSKEEMLAEALVYFIDESISSIAGIAGDYTFYGGFCAVTQKMLETFQNNHSFFQLVFISGMTEEYAQALSGRLSEKCEELTRRMLTLLRQLIALGKAEGVINGEPEDVDILFAFSCILSVFNCQSSGLFPGKLFSKTDAEESYRFLFSKFIKLLS